MFLEFEEGDRHCMQVLCCLIRSQLHSCACHPAPSLVLQQQEDPQNHLHLKSSAPVSFPSIPASCDSCTSIRGPPQLPPHLHAEVEKAAPRVCPPGGLQDKVFAAPGPRQLCCLRHVVPIHTDKSVLRGESRVSRAGGGRGGDKRDSCSPGGQGGPHSLRQPWPWWCPSSRIPRRVPGRRRRARPAARSPPPPAPAGRSMVSAAAPVPATTAALSPARAPQPPPPRPGSAGAARSA